MIAAAEWERELKRRRAAVASILSSTECDAVVVFGCHGHSENFRYLTNFVPVLGDAWALVRPDATLECVLTFGWQLAEARDQSGVAAWDFRFDSASLVAEIVEASNPRRIGIVGLDRIPVMAWETIRATVPKTETVDVSMEVAALRRRKSELELRCLREAAHLTDDLLLLAREEIRPGLTETELAARLSHRLQSAGAEWAFPPCIIGGVADPIPIRLPLARPFEPRDTVMLDLGAAWSGYQADASRTVVVGSASRTQRDVWALVTEAFEAALEQVRPGRPFREIHQAAADVIESAGHTLAHRVGHGIGLATSFEWPSLDTEEAPQEPGMTICIEPGIYVSGAGNMKLEDDIVITETGYELLTGSVRDLELTLG